MTSDTSRVGGTGLLALVVTYGLGRQAYGLFVPFFREQFDLGLDVVGIIGSAAQVGYLAMVVATGWATSRWGARVPVVAGCVAFAMGAGLVASAPGTVLLAVGVTIAGASAGGTWAPFSDAVSWQVPRSGRPRALALVNAGSPLGLVVASAGAVLASERWRLAWVAFAALGLVAAVVSARVLATPGQPAQERRTAPTWRWFLTSRSARLFTAVLAAALACSAYFTFAPDAVAAAGQPRWTGAAMWAVLGIVGGGAGLVAGDLATRYGLWGPSVASWLAVAVALVVLAVVPGSLVAALGSAGLFGAGFTVGYAQVVLWSQRVFADRPTTGFTVTILFHATGFVVGPATLGLVAADAGRGTALLVAAVPAVAAALVRPARDDRHLADTLA